jgi:hypothetical protein
VLALHRLQEQQLLQQQPPPQLQWALSMHYNPTASSSSSRLSHGLQGRSTLAVPLLQQGLQHRLQAVLQAGPAAAAAACRLQERRLQETTRPAFLQSLQEGRLSSC